MNIYETIDAAKRREDVVVPYASEIERQTDFTEFSAINRMIIEKWSPAALRYIKTEAWNLLDLDA